MEGYVTNVLREDFNDFLRYDTIEKKSAPTVARKRFHFAARAEQKRAFESLPLFSHIKLNLSKRASAGKTDKEQLKFNMLCGFQVGAFGSALSWIYERLPGPNSVYNPRDASAENGFMDHIATLYDNYASAAMRDGFTAVPYAEFVAPLSAFDMETVKRAQGTPVSDLTDSDNDPYDVDEMEPAAEWDSVEMEPAAMRRR